jgi:hypothetical protein
MDKPMAVDIAIACAEHVLCFYETKNPQDARPRKAIQAAINWVKDPSGEKQKAAAAAAADAAYASSAYAAAYAAERKWQADMIRELVKCPFNN